MEGHPVMGICDSEYADQLDYEWIRFGSGPTAAADGAAADNKYDFQ